MKAQKLDSKIYHIIKNIRIAVLAMGTAILVFACSNNEIDKIQAFHSPENLPVIEANNFETIQTDSGLVRFSMKTPKLLRFEDGNKFYHEFPEGIQLVKYDAQKKTIWSIEADYAKEFIKEGKWEAKNNVVVTNASGDTLKTEHLILEEKAEKIHTKEFVKIIRGNQTITGIGLISDQNMTNWEIKDPKGTIDVDVKEQKKKTEQTGSQVQSTGTDEIDQSSPQTIKFN